MASPDEFESTAAAGKIPITTTSEEARQEYLKGRHLFESLRGNRRPPRTFSVPSSSTTTFALAYLALFNHGADGAGGVRFATDGGSIAPPRPHPASRR